MKYQSKSFTVPAGGKRDPETCDHEWLDPRGNCVQCGEKPKKSPDE